VFARVKERGLIAARPVAAIDATGLDTTHASHYFQRRCPRGGTTTNKAWPKLSAVFETSTHLIVSAIITQGPSRDSREFEPAMRQAAEHLHFDRVLADAGYDGEHNHRLCREELGIRSTVIKLNRGRSRPGVLPKGKYRRQMATHFPCRVYGERAHAEGGFSRHKRHLGAALAARSQSAQYREILWRVTTHNVMILRPRS